MCDRKYATCPYCGGELEESSISMWRQGGFVTPITDNTNEKGFIVLAFECQECDSETFLNEAVLLDRGYGDRAGLPFNHGVPGLGKSDIMKEVEAKGIPIIPILKYYKYHIKIEGNSLALQDIVFSFGYEWETCGQEHFDVEFEYLTLIPETKRLYYRSSKPHSMEEDNCIVDLKGFTQVLNGIEPFEEPELIEVEGNAVEFHKDGAITVESRDGESCYIPYLTLVDLLSTARENLHPDDWGRNV